MAKPTVIALALFKSKFFFEWMKGKGNESLCLYSFKCIFLFDLSICHIFPVITNLPDFCESGFASFLIQSLLKERGPTYLSMLIGGSSSKLLIRKPGRGFIIWALPSFLHLNIEACTSFMMAMMIMTIIGMTLTISFWKKLKVHCWFFTKIDLMKMMMMAIMMLVVAR